MAFKIPRSEKQGRSVTGKGEALWAFLSEPDKRWKKDYGEFKVNLIMDKGKVSAKLIKDLETVRDEYLETLIGELPLTAQEKIVVRDVYHDNLDAADEETGKLEFKFASPGGGVTKDGKVWTGKVRLFDSQPKQIDGKINVGNGSIIQVNYTPSAYCFKSAETGNYMVGVKCYVNDVMIHKLVEYGGGDHGFEASEDGDGFTYEDGVPEGFKAPAGGGDGNPDF